MARKPKPTTNDIVWINHRNYPGSILQQNAEHCTVEQWMSKAREYVTAKLQCDDLTIIEKAYVRAIYDKLVLLNKDYE